MSGILIVVLVFFVLAAGLGGAAYFVYQRKLRRAKSIERGLKMVPLLIHLPPPSSDTVAGGRDVREVMREKTSQAEVLYNLIAGTAQAGFKSSFYGQRHLALELVAAEGMVHFYVAVPVNLVSVIEKAVLTAYPGAKLEEAEDHNIFNQQGRLSATVGGELVLRADSAYPIATYATLDRDPLQGLLTTLGGLTKTDGAAVQIMIRPAPSSWVGAATKLTTKLRRGRQHGVAFGVADLAKAAVKAPTSAVPADLAKGATNPNLSQLELTAIEQIEEKTKHPGFEVLVRVLVSAESASRSQTVLQQLATSFALFERPGLNGFKFMPAVDIQGLVTAFIFRFFPPELHGSILNSSELATVFHLPDSQFTPTSNVTRQMSKEVDGPSALSSTGLLFGHNEFRGVQKEIRLSPEDRRRHTYILGQTGTGKSTMLENLIVQDMLAGNGFAFIDPHGDSAEKMLALVPKSRAEDVVYFNPADMAYPLGLNLFEFDDPMQKDFLIQESLGMLYKLYDPNGTGVIGPRFEQWYRNAALTLMSDPDGATFIEIPKVFTDTEYLKHKFKYLKDSTVIDFWTKEMGQTSDYHKSEMLGYFVSKFGAFQQNEMMRNIIGQTKSAFNLREIMDQKKILIVNLSKGQVGEMNAKLLGMMLVIKFQAAAMSRANVPENERTDFSLYVDEFQNFSTDSFASILSEARKYRLNLIVGNQFIGQLSNEIREAVFGNIGTILAHRMGPEDAELMVKQYAPIFDASDLMNLPNFHSAARLMVGGLPSQPFTMTDLPPVAGANVELGAAIKQLSAAKFGLARAVVDADIEARLSNRPAPPPAPPRPAAVTPPELMETPPVAAEPAPTPVPEPAPAPMPTPVPEPVPVIDPLPAPVVVAALAPLPEPEPLPPAPIPEPVTPMPEPAPIIAPLPEDDAPEQVRTALGQPLPEEPPAPEVPAVPEPAPVAVTAEVIIPADVPAIGAPPIDLPVPERAASGTLSIRDITGGARQTLVAPAPAELDDIQLIPPGAEPPMPVELVSSDEPIPRSEQLEPALVYDPSTDPNADVPLLGTPPPRLSSVGDSMVAPAVAAGPVYDPATDPHADVPLLPADLGSQPEPVVAPVLTAVATEPIGAPDPILPGVTMNPEAMELPEDELPQSALTVAELVPEPEPVAVVKAPDPVLEVGTEEALPIHFLDPSQAAVLERPYQLDEPEEIKVSEPIPTPVPAEPPVAVPAVVSSAQMAQTPPPIGAPPVGVAATPEAPVVAPLAAAPVVDPELAPAVAPTPEPESKPEPILEPEPTAIETPAPEPIKPPEAVPAMPAPVVTPEPEAKPEVVSEPAVSVPLPVPEPAVAPVVEAVAAVPAIAAPEVVPEPAAVAPDPIPVVTAPVAEPVTELAAAVPQPEVAKPMPAAEPEPEPTPRPELEPESEPKPKPKTESKPEPAQPETEVDFTAKVAPVATVVTAPEPPADKPVVAETPPVVEPPAPQLELPAKAAEVVAETEAAIDDLLSTSLIHDDDSKRHRLPEVEEESADAPVATPPHTEAPADGKRHWVGSSLPPETTASEDDDEGSASDHEPAIYSTGSSHKVIEPLGPIVPRREELVKELVAEAAADLADEAPPVIAPAPQPAAPTEAPKVAVKAVVPAPVEVAVPEPDFALPEAESLAADDVAKARDEERRLAAAAAADQAAAAAVTPPPPPHRESKKAAERKAQRSTKAERRVIEPPAPKAASVVPTPAPVVAPPAAPKAESLAGQLILPSAHKAAEAAAPVAAKRPDKLNKGEIFVDEKGNVIMGD